MLHQIEQDLTPAPAGCWAGCCDRTPAPATACGCLITTGLSLVPSPLPLLFYCLCVLAIVHVPNWVCYLGALLQQLKSNKAPKQDRTKFPEQLQAWPLCGLIAGALGATLAPVQHLQRAMTKGLFSHYWFIWFLSFSVNQTLFCEWAAKVVPAQK